MPIANSYLCTFFSLTYFHMEIGYRIPLLVLICNNFVAYSAICTAVI